MIKVRNLTKRYVPDKAAVDKISFDIKSGEICGYIGANGAGKSTTVKILCGAMSFDEGQVTVSNIDVSKDPLEVKKIIGYVPENANLFNSLSMTEYLEFAGILYNIDNQILRKRIEYFAELFDFKDLLKHSIGNISKGNKQKVLITAALFHNPDVIFLDEPLNGLDANAIFTFQHIISELAKKGKTIFYCSHLLDTIEKISTKIIIIENGKITMDRHTEELKNSKDFISLETLFRNMNRNNESKIFKYEDIFD
jgi:ABC-2 type transport system ATP-binding protein